MSPLSGKLPHAMKVNDWTGEHAIVDVNKYIIIRDSQVTDYKPALKTDTLAKEYLMILFRTTLIKLK